MQRQQQYRFQWTRGNRHSNTKSSGTTHKVTNDPQPEKENTNNENSDKTTDTNDQSVKHANKETNQPIEKQKTLIQENTDNENKENNTHRETKEKQFRIQKTTTYTQQWKLPKNTK